MLAKNVVSFIFSSGMTNLFISLSVFKSKITIAGGATTSYAPQTSATPVSINQSRSHSSARILNTDTISLSAKGFRLLLFVGKAAQKKKKMNYRKAMLEKIKKISVRIL